jgi:hypothetical protein
MPILDTLGQVGETPANIIAQIMAICVRLKSALNFMDRILVHVQCGDD